MTNNTVTRRPKAKIMAKLYRDSKAFSCNEFNFDRTLDNYYVSHHLAELNGDVECTDDNLGWNGLLHFSAPFTESVREYVRKLTHVLDVVVAYHDPYTDRYHFIVDTHAENLSEDNFRILRSQMAKVLRKHVEDMTAHFYNFYVRALPADCYDILNRNAIFNH